MIRTRLQYNRAIRSCRRLAELTREKAKLLDQMEKALIRERDKL